MRNITKHFKRILTDTAGYTLILIGIAFGWLPGPGGIPAIVAGLGLLSINNAWAARLRDYLLKHGGDFVKVAFPPNRTVQILYDILVIVLFIAVAVLSYYRMALWQITLSIALFFFALFIAAVNRDRYQRLKHKHK